MMMNLCATVPKTYLLVIVCQFFPSTQHDSCGKHLATLACGHGLSMQTARKLALVIQTNLGHVDMN